MSVIFGLSWMSLAKYALPVVIAGSLFVYGTKVGADSVELKYAKQREDAGVHQRNQDRKDENRQREIDQALSDALQDGIDRANDAERRMRDLSAKYRAALKGQAVCRDDAPPGARLSDETRADLVAEARRANAIVEQLTACQASINK